MKSLLEIPIRLDGDRKQKVRILYQDEALLVVDKPAGLLVIPDHWNPEQPNLKQLLESRFPNRQGDEIAPYWVVHRIDRDTSGLVIFARQAPVHRMLNQMFENQEVRKTYLAIVVGQLARPEGSIQLPLRRHPVRKQFVYVHPKGKPARTDYQIREQFERFALLEAKPHTGRTHQIRVHFSAIGHPLAIDPLYGKTEAIYIENLKQSPTRNDPWEEPRPIMGRLTLHAYRLSFAHPVTGEPLHFQAEPPKDFRALLRALRKWDARKTDPTPA